MPKEKKDPAVSFDRSRAFPYPCSSSCGRRATPKKLLGTKEDLKEWEDARCPVCMEHPHNAVLLRCSSHDKGCRPYMCDTSYRHSNCFDQFRKSSAKDSPTMLPEEGTSFSTTLPSSSNLVSEAAVNNVVNAQESTLEESSEKQIKAKLLCPLCRGEINGWVVLDPARHFMNAKSRSCACEDCSFNGTYADLRKHARLEHPLVRPTEADPERQRNWRRLERQRDLGDLLSTLQTSFRDERGVIGESDLPIDEGGWLTMFFLIRVFRPGFSTRSSSWSGGGSRTRGQLSVRGRYARLWGEGYDGEAGSSYRDEDSESEDSSSPRRHRERVRHQSTPENEP